MELRVGQEPNNSESISFLIIQVRSGHSLDAFGNKLVLFGGIHDITWELDDMYCFDTDTQEWMVVDDDSSRRKDT
jgi:hypothetical protein